MYVLLGNRRLRVIGDVRVECQILDDDIRDGVIDVRRREEIRPVTRMVLDFDDGLLPRTRDAEVTLDRDPPLA